MKKAGKLLGFCVLMAIIGLLVTGCLTLGSNVSIRSDGNLSSVRPGGTLRFSATGRGIVWAVSSTSDGLGPVTDGTYISGSGVLSVGYNETHSVLYVIATSTETGQSVYRQVRVTTVSGIEINPQNATVRRGRTLQFSASVTGSNNPDNAATWKVSSNASGTGAVTPGTSINSNGVLTVGASETLTFLYVIGTSVVDPSKSASTAVSIIIPIVHNVAVSPPNQSITSGGTIQFNAAVTGINDPSNAVTWRVSSDASGTGPVTQGTSINNNGLLTVAPNEKLTALYVFASSVEDPTKSGSVIVTVIVPIVSGVVVSSGGQTVTRGGTLQFNASVTGTNNPSNLVTWRVSSNAAGTGGVIQGTSINANGLLTVAARETATVLYIIATSAADPTKTGSIAVSVIIPVVSGVTVSPTGQSVERGRTLQFNAAVTGSNNPSNAVTWRVSSNASGTGAVTSGTSINANGVLTVSANETNTMLYVIATSVADTTKSGNAAVIVIIPAASGNQNQQGQNQQGQNQNQQGQNQQRPGQNQQGQNQQGQNQQGQNQQGQNQQGQNQQRPGQNQQGQSQQPVATVTGVTVSPANQSVNRGGTLQCSASVAGANNPSTAVTWKVSSNAAGTGAVTSGTSINASGVLTVSANETNATLYVIATSVADTTKSSSITVRVNIPTVTSVSVSPGSQTVNRGGSQQFTSSVVGTNNPNNAVTWRVSSNTAGTGAVTSGTSINANGVLTVSANETNTTLYVIATSAADTTKSGRATITVPAPPAVTGVTISPANPTVAVGSPLDLSATVAGTASNKSVTWKVSSNAAGTGAVGNGTSINNNGKLTISANETAATLYVTATSVADPTKSATIAVTVIKKN